MKAETSSKPVSTSPSLRQITREFLFVNLRSSPFPTFPVFPTNPTKYDYRLAQPWRPHRNSHLRLSPKTSEIISSVGSSASFRMSRSIICRPSRSRIFATRRRLSPTSASKCTQNGIFCQISPAHFCLYLHICTCLWAFVSVFISPVVSTAAGLIISQYSSGAQSRLVLGTP